MRDDYLTSDWAAQHRRSSGSIHVLLQTIGKGLERLNARQFDAPWRRLPEPAPHATR